MSEAVTALGGARFAGVIEIAEAPLTGMLTVRGALDDAALGAAVKQVSGAQVPGPRGADFAGFSGAGWMSPDELLLLVPYAEADARCAALHDALSGSHALAVNVSDARALFTLRGAALRDVLAKLTPADLRPAQLAPGTLVRSRLGHVAAAFWLEDDETAHLVCFRSVARYVFDLLSRAADPAAAPGVLSGAG